MRPVQILRRIVTSSTPVYSTILLVLLGLGLLAISRGIAAVREPLADKWAAEFARENATPLPFGTSVDLSIVASSDDGGRALDAYDFVHVVLRRDTESRRSLESLGRLRRVLPCGTGPTPARADGRRCAILGVGFRSLDRASPVENPGLFAAPLRHGPGMNLVKEIRPAR